MIALLVASLAVALIVGAIIGRASRRLPVADPPIGVPNEIRRGSIVVRRLGAEVDEVIVRDRLHLEIMAQPYADDPPSERYAHVSVIAETPDGRVNLAITSEAPITVTVLEPTEVAC